MPSDDPATRRALIDHAIETVRSNFQGRGPRWQEIHDDLPRNLFPSGTLYAGGDGDLAEELESEFGKTKYKPSALGFSLKTSRTDALALEVAVEFSVYYPVNPAWADVQRFLQRFDQGALQVRMPAKYRRVHLRVPAVAVTIPVTETDGFEMCQAATDALQRALDGARQQALNDPELFALPARAQRGGRTRTYDRADVADEGAWTAQLRAATRRAEPAWAGRVIYRVREIEGGHLVEVLLANYTNDSEWGVHETAFIGGSMRVRADSTDVVRIDLPGVEARDYRHEAWTLAAGKNCDTEASVDGSTVTVRTQSVPLYVQPRLAARSHSANGRDIKPTFEALSRPEGLQVLQDLETAMRLYLRDWDTVASTAPSSHETAQIAAGRAQFAAEVERYSRGLALLRDPANRDILDAFCLMNESFDRRFTHVARARALRTGAPPPTSKEGWRLFQIAFIVGELGDILHRDAARGGTTTPDPTVLWFPTGGGKTEAYLGLVVLHAFWDRLRGKPFGTTAFAKFPLRMLSLQQFARVVDVVEHADDVRAEAPQLEGKRGDPFSVGYYAGGDNTLNLLDFPVSPDRAEKRTSWTKDFLGYLRAPDRLDKQCRKHRKVTRCPTCHDAEGNPGEIETTFDETKPGFRHTCTSCRRELNLHLTDTEVLRWLPTLVIATIDKLARLATEPWGRAIFGEAKVACPTHGYLLGRSLDRDGKPVAQCPVLNCTETLRDTPPNVDPVPSLLVQDELHLLTESLGAFASHYETMLAETARVLQTRGVGRGPWKVVGSTATIEGYQQLVRQLYNHGRCHRFPAPGPVRGESFYAYETDEVQRLVLGVRPHGVSHVDTVMKVLLEWHKLTVPLADLPLCAAGTSLAPPLAGITEDERKKLARRYRTALTYGIQRNEVTQVNNSYFLQLNLRMRQLGLPPFETSRVWNLTGDSDVSRLQYFLEAVESGRDDRYVQAATATSIISHGVDLDDLNFMVFRGVPHTTAEYIQAMSRVGRGAGVPALVVNVYNPNRERDAAHFESHAKFLELRDILVRHVPTTRFSRQALERTVPGLVLHYVNYERPLYNLWRRTTVEGLLVEVRDNYDEVVAAVKRRLGLDTAPDDTTLVRRQRRYVEEDVVARIRSKLQQRPTDANESMYASERLGALRSLRETDVTIDIWSQGSLTGGDD